ncbi:TRAP transporter small permease [Bacillus sp. NSP9.1]|uniref:TRAP transporter small permease n=1 Tax=Bacillus sp. NSP9.1 TaxID=1071078 RepID=UPI00047D4268|nr:TRAP transporter small permease [Bacillus sp. NSP9.1]QHZ48465.1 TRAP transporter small permease [Bacillus sp. NSP9.1]
MKALRWLDKHFEEYLLIFLSCFTVVVIFIQVFMRYVLSSSLVWSEEIARYAFIWMIYIGVSYGVKKNKHLAVDAFAMLFERRGELIIGIIANSLFLVFAVTVSYFGLEIMMLVTRESAAIQLPLGWVYAAPVVGLALTSIRIIQKLVYQFKSLKQDNNVEYVVREGVQ